MLVTVSNTVPLQGMVAYWTFDEGSGTTANDSSGSGNKGTLFNSPAWTTGKINGALSFNGVNNYVSTPALNAGGDAGGDGGAVGQPHLHRRER